MTRTQHADVECFRMRFSQDVRSHMAHQRSERDVPDGRTPSLNEEEPATRKIGDVIAGMSSGSAPQTPDMSNVAKRLWHKFGKGENPALRRELYERLERAVVEHGWPAYRVIQGCVRSADSASAPDRYFCTAVACRMREAGYISDASGGQF